MPTFPQQIKLWNDLSVCPSLSSRSLLGVLQFVGCIVVVFIFVCFFLLPCPPSKRHCRSKQKPWTFSLSKHLRQQERNDNGQYNTSTKITQCLWAAGKANKLYNWGICLFLWNPVWNISLSMSCLKKLTSSRLCRGPQANQRGKAKGGHCRIVRTLPDGNFNESPKVYWISYHPGLIFSQTFGLFSHNRNALICISRLTCLKCPNSWQGSASMSRPDSILIVCLSRTFCKWFIELKYNTWNKKKIYILIFILALYEILKWEITKVKRYRPFSRQTFWLVKAGEAQAEWQH